MALGGEREVKGDVAGSLPVRPSTMMTNPRRNSYGNSQSSENQGPAHALSSVISFLKKPHAIPFLLFIFIVLTWLSLRLQLSDSRFSYSTSHNKGGQFEGSTGGKWSSSGSDDHMANIVRFTSAFPSLISKDKRGWLINPVSIANDALISGGAMSCTSPHVGQIRPGGVRGNHRHHSCNETFVIWGARTKFRLETSEVVGKSYAEVIVAADEVAVAASPSGTAHALINVDPVRSTFFLGCQDNIIHKNATTDFKIWSDL